MTAFKIEKNVPLIGQGRGAKPKYPWREMAVGDSFFVPKRTVYNFSGGVSSATKATGFKFSMRAENDGVRVWRIA